ncbi:penicillin acylase family protein [Marinoscillum sp. MHG1-6]|uniref:penicillin acylase family protein n=1 Tax=Marinoscillum sp. MHG1-6 TaxID=2959627 RepID=UPI00215742C2|nr:penicillin acylase family protein [Marinoscillum sp. MHG1-6]
MKTIRFLILLAITLAVAISLNSKFGETPPLAKLLSPFEGYLQNIESTYSINESLNIDGLSESVKVQFDDLQIPHIYAKNNHDLYFTQGYLTARDRLWQMDIFARMTLGRLSEVLGERALNFDRLNRRIGLKKITHDLWSTVQKDEELREMIVAYSDGVNAYIDQLSYAKYPIEFKLLDYEPEKWSPLKSCMAYAMLCNTLSRSESDLENTNLLKVLGKKDFDLLFPDQLGNLDPIIPTGTKWDFDPAQTFSSTVRNPMASIEKTIDKPSPLYGSNNFVASGQKTTNGNVLFANETDLKLDQPSIWHAAHLNADGINTMGVTVPGTPVILIGFNDSLVWGLTNSPRDQVDWYTVQFKNDERKEYWYNNQWFKTEQVIEKIKIRGSDPFMDTVVYVHHGPVVYDRNFYSNHGKLNCAMRWVAHLEGNSYRTLYNINRSQSAADFKNALKTFQGPPNNILIGTAQGDIGIYLPGKFPIKSRGAGKFLMDGSSPSQEFSTMIPFEHMLQYENPEKGFLSSANQHPADSTYPYYYYDHHYEFYRNRRVNDRLEKLGQVDVKDFKKLQNDNYNYHASEILPTLLDSLDTTTFTPRHWSYYQALSKWDYFNEAELKAPSMYKLWWDILYRNTWDELDTITSAITYPDKFIASYLIKNQPDLKYFNRLSTPQEENASDLIKISFDQAVDSLEAWDEANETDFVWYLVKGTEINHLLQLDPFSFKNVKIGGGKSIVNAASKFAGPSWRMIVDMGPDGPEAWGIYPGSQSGNPGNESYGGMINDWAAGKYYKLTFGPQVKDSKNIKQTVTLLPKR